MILLRTNVYNWVITHCKKYFSLNREFWRRGQGEISHGLNTFRWIRLKNRKLHASRPKRKLWLECNSCLPAKNNYFGFSLLKIKLIQIMSWKVFMQKNMRKIFLPWIISPFSSSSGEPLFRITITTGLVFIAKLFRPEM